MGGDGEILTLQPDEMTPGENSVLKRGQYCKSDGTKQGLDTDSEKR